MAKPRDRGKKPKAKGKSGDSRKEATVLIPLTYNDGSAIPLDVLEAIHEELFLAFHGWTIEGTVKGAYRMRSGMKQVEDLQKLSVILDESQLPELEAMIGRWGARLGQESMLLKVSDFTVRFIPPREEAE